MTTTSAASLKATIVTALAAANLSISVFDYPKPEKRKIFPSIEIVPTRAETGDADVKITNVSQGWDIILRIRTRGGGTDEVNFQKTIEDTVFAAITNTVLGQPRLHILNKTWNRPNSQISKPIPHLQSTLVVLITTDTSTTGTGQLITEQTVDFPGATLTGMKLLSKPVETEIDLQESIKNDTNVRVAVARITNARSFFCEVELTTARLLAFRALKTTGDKIAITLHRKDANDVFNGKIATINHGGILGDIETLTVGVEVF